MKKIPWLHIVLFIATFLSTLAVGALQVQPIENITKDPSKILKGLPFSLTLMLILLCHELSHYIASKKHHIKATLPYFIPAPTLIGTMGAFIKMKSPITTRMALIDIGASGPIAGFIISLIATLIGLPLSQVILTKGIKGSLALGDSLLFSLLSRLILGEIPDSYDVLLHPIAFAGWIGFFVTALNLIPIGQLDGGHIAYAIMGEKHIHISKVLVPVLIVLGFFLWEGWIIWGVLLLILGLRHPPVLYWETPLDKNRRSIGWITAIIFIITFIPMPFKALP
ncbi:MAG: site-2 protease family protein [Thermodesulfovibrionales bacterium]|nr:site-2 protease family protein [Thermodesulfovibrionales bacterium]